MDPAPQEPKKQPQSGAPVPPPPPPPLPPMDLPPPPGAKSASGSDTSGKGAMTAGAPGAPGASAAPAAPAQDVVPPKMDDEDLIEKEWVNKAKHIVEKNRNDPYKQSEELTAFRADYMKKRYGKNIKSDK